MTDIIYYDDTISDDDYSALSQTMQYSNVFFGDYFRSLLGEALRCGYFEKEFGDNVKRELGKTLASLINEFTKGESTSVMQDTADELFSSILYSIDIKLMFEYSHSKALDLISQKSVPELYYEGQKLIERLIIESVGLLVKARSTRPGVSDKTLDQMLDSEIRDWIFRYDKRFFAHRTRRSSTYQTFLGCGRLRGILYSKKYLENLIAENRYLSRFDSDELSELCFDYSLSRTGEYNNTGTNIFGLVFTNQIMRYVSGIDDKGILLSPKEAKEASKALRKLNAAELKSRINEASEFLTDDVYAKRCVYNIYKKIEESVSNNRLRGIISVRGEK